MGLKIASVKLDETAGDVAAPIDGEFWYNTTTDRLRARQAGASNDVLDSSRINAASGVAGLDGSSKLADAQVAESNVTQHVAAINHDALLNYAVGQHRVINDAGTSSTELWSASKINTEIQSVSQGIDIKDPVATSTEGLGNITLSGEQTLNGVTTSSSRVLVMEQTATEENGIYISAAGAWSRSTDADEDAEVTSGLRTYVSDSNSTKFGNEYNLVTADPITVDTTGLTFLLNQRLVFGSSAGTVAEGNDSRIPSQDENDALVGTSGTPSTSNKYVTNDDSRVAASSETNSGHIELATQAETDAGSDDARAVTPLKLKNSTWAKTGLELKAGQIAAGSFSGTPKTASVVYSTAFTGGTPIVTVSPIVSDTGETFAPAISASSTTGFTVTLASDVTTDLTFVNWTALLSGEEN